MLGDRPILDRPIMPNLGQQILRDEIRKEIVGRRVERAAGVRDRIRELYYRDNHPFVYWWHYMWTRHPVWSSWRSHGSLPVGDLVVSNLMVWLQRLLCRTGPL